MQVRRTDEFAGWLERLRDRESRRRIEQRLDRVAETGNLGDTKVAETGNLGDTKYVGGDVTEMRLHFGPGSRLYFAQREQTIIFLLLGGDKATQSRDIIKAQIIASLLDS